MLKYAAILVVLMWTLSGCETEGDMRKIDPYLFINDGSSKIWLVDKLLINRNDYTPMRFKFKQMIAFHESRNAYFYRVNEFGDKPGLRTYYWMDRSKNEFGFDVGKKRWVFDIRLISRTKIVLKPKYKSYPYTMVLVPFPEY